MKFSISIFTILFITIFLSGCKSFPHGSEHYGLETVIDAAQEEGINAIIHGADHKRKLYVISWSNPKSFFNRYNFSIAPTDRHTSELFKTLNRGDRVFVQGKSQTNHGQPHIYTKNLKVIKKYDPQIKFPAGQFSRKTELPGTLLDKKREIFYVHAIANKGKILVLEHGDTIVPMIVKNNKHSHKLHRGDYVDIAYKVTISDNPHQPTHLELNEKNNQPIKVIDAIVDLHQKDLDYEGRLVLFPKSPTINRNIFAIEIQWKDPKKAARYFTLMPAEFKGDNFKNILKKLQDAWDKHPDEVFKSRNKFIHQKLRIKVKGKGNIVSENQANAQIFTQLEDIKIIEK